MGSRKSTRRPGSLFGRSMDGSTRGNFLEEEDHGDIMQEDWVKRAR